MEKTVSAASQVIISVIPIVGIVMGAAVVFFYILWAHKEKMLMIEKGTYTPRHIDIDAYSLLLGILLVAVGITLSVVFFSMSAVGYTLLGGLVPLSVGIGFLSFYVFRSRRRTK